MKNLLEHCMVEHKALFYKIAYTYMRSHCDTEDVLHNAYEKAYRNVNQLKDPKKIKYWLISIIRNEANSLIKKNNRFQDQEIKQDLELAKDIALQVDLKAALNQLSEEQRDLVVMKYLLGYKQKEIALIMQIPKGTVKSKISRALKALREILGGDYA